MTNLVIPMPPMSMRAIQAAAHTFLRSVAPEVLERPVPLDLPKLIDHRLPAFGIHISPANPDELEGSEGLTIPDGDGHVDILIDVTQYESIYCGGPRAYRGKSTATHELGHATLHVPIIRHRRDVPSGPLMLRRVAARTLRSYCHPEWQAFAFGGCILMPPSTLEMLDDLSPRHVSHVYEVSEQLALNHLRRLKMI